jgi:hypothetical protein
MDGLNYCLILLFCISALGWLIVFNFSLYIGIARRFRWVLQPIHLHHLIHVRFRYALH